MLCYKAMRALGSRTRPPAATTPASQPVENPLAPSPPPNHRPSDRRHFARSLAVNATIVLGGGGGGGGGRRDQECS